MSKLWHSLEAIPHQTGVIAVWRQFLKDDFEPLQAAFLTRKNRVAQTYSCLEGCGCVHDVVEHNGRFIAVCTCNPRNCADIPLQKEDLYPYELNWDKLGASIIKAFGFMTRKASLDVPGAKQIAAFTKAAIPVILIIQHEPLQFRTAISRLVAKNQTEFILLAPTSQFWDAACQEELNRVDADFLPLDANLKVSPSGQLTPAHNLQEILAEFVSQQEEASEEAVNNAFAILKKLDEQAVKRQPTHSQFFMDYCTKNLSIDQISKKYKCSQGLASNRKTACELKLNKSLQHFRQYGDLIEKTHVKDPRAKRINNKASIY